MKITLLAALASLVTGSSWSVHQSTEVRRIEDKQLGVACYVVGDGYTIFSSRGISCVKVQQ